MRRSNSHFSVTFGLTSSIKVMFDSFLSVQAFSIEIAHIIHNQQTFHHRLKMPKSVTFIVFLRRYSNS